MRPLPAIVLMFALLPRPAVATPGSEAAASPARHQSIVRPLGGRPVPVSSAALLVSGMTGGRLEVAPWAAALPSGGPERRVLTGVDLSWRVLEDLPGPWSLDIVTYAFTPDEAVAATSSLRLELDGEVDGALGGRGIQIVGALNLEPGSYTLRTLIRERQSGELALVATELEVPGRGAGRAPTALWLLRPAAGWVLALAAEDEPVPWRIAGDEPGELIASPRADLEPGARARALMLLPGRSSVETATVTLRDALGGEVAIVPARLEALPGAGALPETRIATFTVPPLEPGAHTLSLVVEGVETRDLSFLAPAPTLPAAEGGGGATAGLPPEVTATLRGSKRSVRAAIALYKEALAFYAAGDSVAAAKTLRGLEEGVRQNQRSSGLQWLMKAQQNLITRLAAQAPSGLTPALGLHAGVLGAYSAAGDLALEGHTMQVLLRLAAEIARRATPADRPRGAVALARAGASLQSAGWALQADRLFELALKLDGRNRAALLGAAALREKTEQYPQAVALLESLVAAHPEDEEGRLRLALNLARLKRAPRAVDLLRALAPAAETEWISIVAFHELARLQAERDAAAAVATLEAGLARWPGEQGLVLLLSLLHERHNPGQAASIPVELLRGAPDGTAPRYRYNRWPRAEAADDLDEAGHRELARWCEGRAP